MLRFSTLCALFRKLYLGSVRDVIYLGNYIEV